MTWSGWDVVEEVCWYRERQAERSGELLGVLELEPRVVAAAIAAEVRANPRRSWCLDRRCGHKAGRHKDGACTVAGCACEGLQEAA